VPRQHLGKHLGRGKQFSQLGSFHAIQFRPGEHRIPWVHQTQLQSYRPGSGRMVAGYHLYLDARLAAGGQGLPGFLAWRVVHGDQAG
jgi:hypothetical protein